MRTTIADLSHGAYDYSRHVDLADRKARRYHPFSYDFDSTAQSLTQPEEHWDEQVKQLHSENRAQTIKRLELRYGALNIEEVIRNSIDLGPKSLSLITHHNALHEQARRAFIAGFYYPALVAACALGERILNHLVLDLRDSFKSSEHYKKVYRKDSFDQWPFAVAVLSDWNVLTDGVGLKFLDLGKLRNRSIHFDPETYQSLRADALAALHQLDGIIEKQFGYFGPKRWFIEGTSGAVFVKREYENDPFVRAYIIPRSGFVGHLYGMDRSDEGAWSHLDYSDYGDEDVSDEEFARRLRERDPAKVVTREMIERSLEE